MYAIRRAADGQRGTGGVVRYDTLYADSHPPIHTVYDTIANKDTVYVWVHMRHQQFRDRDGREQVYGDDAGEGIRSYYACMYTYKYMYKSDRLFHCSTYQAPIVNKVGPRRQYPLNRGHIPFPCCRQEIFSLQAHEIKYSRKNNTLEHELKKMELTHAHIHTYNHIHINTYVHTYKYIHY